MQLLGLFYAIPLMVNGYCFAGWLKAYQNFQTFINGFSLTVFPSPDPGSTNTSTLFNRFLVCLSIMVA